MPEERVRGAALRAMPHQNLPAEGKGRASVKPLCFCGCHLSLLFGFPKSCFSAACSTSLFCTLEGDCSMPSNLSDLKSSNYSNLTWIPGSSVKAMDLHTSHTRVPACDVESFSPTFPETDLIPETPQVQHHTY